MIKLLDIPITQSGVRDMVQVAEMAKFVRGGGIFDEATIHKHHTSTWAQQPILIARLEDGQQFYHDGHHRLLGIYLGGRDFLYPEEIDYFDITHAKYWEVNFETGWLTPVRMAEELRVPNIHEFKRYVKYLPQDQAEAWVRANRHLYCSPRGDMHTVADLAKYLGFHRSQFCP